MERDKKAQAFNISTTTTSIPSSTATFNPGQKRPQPSAGIVQQKSVQQQLQQILASTYSQLPTIQNPLITLAADANLLQQNANLFNGTLKTIGVQRQEIAAKRIRFGPSLATPAPNLIPVNTTVNQTTVIQQSTTASASATNAVVQQQQQMALSPYRQQQTTHLPPPPSSGDGGGDDSSHTAGSNTVVGSTDSDYIRYGEHQYHHHFEPNGAPPSSLQLQTVDGIISQSYQDLSNGIQQQPNSILRIIIDSMLYPVTLDVLYLIFSRYGKVLRIITFNKNNLFQALIQLSEASAAQNAKNSLDGLNIYQGCCTLRIEYSKLNTLNVKWNNDKSRDYTNPNLPSGDLTYEQKLQLILQNAQMNNGLGQMIPLAFNSFPFNTVSLPPSNELLASNPQLLTNNLAGVILNTANSQFPAGITTTPVVLVSNLDETKLRMLYKMARVSNRLAIYMSCCSLAVTPDQLFTLFGVYGDVIRVKILFNKKDNALIQYSDAQQAQLAIQHLDKVKWNGRNMRVTASKHTVVQMPKEGQPDAGLTKEFVNSSLHRFKKPGSKNYMNIYPPSSTLHLSNIPNGMSEEAMRDIFKDFPIVEFKFFQKDHKMALLQLEDVESAINILVNMHNYKLAESAHLRVSFSKKGING